MGKRLALLALSGVAALAGCDGDEECPEAQAVYDTSLSVFESLEASVPFATEWELVLRQQEERRPHLADALLPLTARYDNGRRVGVQGAMTLDVPGPPEPLTCSDAVQIKDAVAEEQAEMVISLYYFSILSGYGELQMPGGDPYCSLFAPPGLEELFCGAEPWTIQVAGTATSSWDDGGELEFAHCMPTPSVILCCLPSSCPFSEKKGCSGQQSHQVNGTMGMMLEMTGSSFDPTSAEVNLIDMTVTPDLDHEGTQPWEYCDFNPQRGFDECLVECATAGDPSPCCVDACAGFTLENVQDEFSCDVSPMPLADWTFPLTEGTHVLHSSETETRRERVEVTLRCTSGCECTADTECDDGRVCTRDECSGGNCRFLPDDGIVPEQVEGDCRYCESGTERSVRAEFERECELIRRDAIRSCSSLGDNWRVHWVTDAPGSSAQWHYCLAGESPGSAVEPVCSGAGECASGSPTTSLTGQSSVGCVAPDGQELDFACEVLCTVCS